MTLSEGGCGVVMTGTGHPGELTQALLRPFNRRVSLLQVEDAPEKS